MVQSVSRLFESPHEFSLRSPLIARIMSELESPDTVSGLILESHALELISTVARCKAPAFRTSVPFARACEYLDAHVGSVLRIRDVAGAAGVHAAHLSRLFRRHAGCSPGQWQRIRRIEQAKHHLRTTAKPIAAIALALGFYDQSHFSNVFRRAVGMTPAQFRQMHRN